MTGWLCRYYSIRHRISVAIHGAGSANAWLWLGRITALGFREGGDKMTYQLTEMSRYNPDGDDMRVALVGSSDETPACVHCGAVIEAGVECDECKND